MTGDAPTRVPKRHTSLPAQERDDPLVEVRQSNASATVNKEVVDQASGLGVEHSRVRQPLLFPDLDRLPDNGINGLGESSRRLVDRHIEQAGRRGGNVARLDDGQLPAGGRIDRRPQPRERRR